MCDDLLNPKGQRSLHCDVIVFCKKCSGRYSATAEERQLDRYNHKAVILVWTMFSKNIMFHWSNQNKQKSAKCLSMPFFYYMGRSAESSSSSYSTHSCSVLYKNSLCCILSPFWHIRQHTTSVCSHTAPEQQPQRCLQQQQRHHGCISSFSFFLPQDVISCWAGTSLSLLLKLATNWPSLAKQCTAAALNVKCVCVWVYVLYVWQEERESNISRADQ